MRWKGGRFEYKYHEFRKGLKIDLEIVDDKRGKQEKVVRSVKMVFEKSSRLFFCPRSESHIL